mmetsp:Transcript_24583/g.80334  ORF Transcript_24583/g.80334 Transcript_24583/m.80334 type:complete len:374 (-) Transcript_24583:1235-2356(-)
MRRPVSLSLNSFIAATIFAQRCRSSCSMPVPSTCSTTMASTPSDDFAASSASRRALFAFSTPDAVRCCAIFHSSSAPSGARPCAAISRTAASRISIGTIAAIFLREIFCFFTSFPVCFSTMDSRTSRLIHDGGSTPSSSSTGPLSSATTAWLMTVSRTASASESVSARTSEASNSSRSPDSYSRRSPLLRVTSMTSATNHVASSVCKTSTSPPLSHRETSSKRSRMREVAVPAVLGPAVDAASEGGILSCEARASCSYSRTAWSGSATSGVHSPVSREKYSTMPVSVASAPRTRLSVSSGSDSNPPRMESTSMALPDLMRLSASQRMCWSRRRRRSASAATVETDSTSAIHASRARRRHHCPPLPTAPRSQPY